MNVYAESKQERSKVGELPKNQCLTVIIPVYNECYCLHAFFASLAQAPLNSCPSIDGVELIVVDDGSTDGTQEILQEIRASRPLVGGVATTMHVITQPRNCGKGAAVRLGVEKSCGDIVMIQDADLEYSPEDYPKLLKPILDGKADVVFGSRFEGHPRRVFYYWHAVFNHMLTTLANILNDLTLTDLTTCYKAMTGPMARSLVLRSNRFGIEAELVSRVAAAHARIYEVAVSYHGRTYEEGKKFNKMDGLAMFFHVLRFGLWDREPYKPGLMQTLNALDALADTFYRPILDRALALAKEGTTKKIPRILEVGAGMGSITRFLVKKGEVTACDIEEEHVRHLNSRLAFFQGFRAITWDVCQPTPMDLGKFDLIVMFNVLEHIENDQMVLSSLRSRLAPSGRIILVVPNHPWLLNKIDRMVGHQRRYTKESLTMALSKSGFTTKSMFCGNSFGIAGWFIHGMVSQRSDIPKGRLLLYAVLKKLFHPLEKLLDKATGLSLIAVAMEKEELNTSQRKAA